MQASEIFEHIKLKFPQVSVDELGGAVVVPKELFLEVAGYLKSGELFFDNLHCVTALDRKDRIELVYIFYSFKMRHRLILKVYLPAGDPEAESLAQFYRSADWFEREVYDMFGVKFRGHPDLRRILNPPDWEGYPLRKDYSHPDLIIKPRD